MTGDPTIDVRDVSVLFPLYHGNSRSLKKLLVAAASGRLAEDRRHRVTVRALSNITFNLKSGERLGLIGSNGAGKTTLLRVLAGIYEPVTCKTACKTFQIPGVNSAQKFPPWPCDDPAFPLENLGCCSWT